MPHACTTSFLLPILFLLVYGWAWKSAVPPLEHCWSHQDYTTSDGFCFSKCSPPAPLPCLVSVWKTNADNKFLYNSFSAQMHTAMLAINGHVGHLLRASCRLHCLMAGRHFPRCLLLHYRCDHHRTSTERTNTWLAIQTITLYIHTGTLKGHSPCNFLAAAYSHTTRAENAALR